ncbi:MAG: arginase family protein, partial [Halobacteria archaeon]|nr:arginase family protein [Halobacteria archaeon]
RKLSHGYEPYVRSADVSLDEVAVHDYGDVDTWNDAEEVLEFAEAEIERIVDEGGVPLVVGGEHTVSVPGYRATEADAFVVVDAHLDLKEEYRGEEYSHACVSRRAVEDGLDVVNVGARAGSRDEYDFAERGSVDVFDADYVREDEEVVDEVAEAVEGYDRPYLSVDVDALDPGFAPGVGTPEPFGLRPETVRDVVREVAPDCVGFDVVEVCPSHDDGEAALVAAKLMQEFVASRESG